MAGEFADLISEGQLGRVTYGVEVAVTKSFETDQKRLGPLHISRAQNITRSEVKRRTDICLRIFKELRGDLKWGVERILDHLPQFLRAELDGVPWRPDTEHCLWTPGTDIR